MAGMVEPTFDINAETSRHLLEKFQARSSMIVPFEVLRRTKMYSENQELTHYVDQGIRLHFESILHREKFDTVELKVETPETWFDAFKEQVVSRFLNWFARNIHRNTGIKLDNKLRSTIKYKTVSEKYETYVVYPSLKIASPDSEHYMTMVKFNPEKLY